MEIIVRDSQKQHSTLSLWWNACFGSSIVFILSTVTLFFHDGSRWVNSMWFLSALVSGLCLMISMQMRKYCWVELMKPLGIKYQYDNSKFTYTYQDKTYSELDLKREGSSLIIVLQNPNQK